MSWSTNRMTPAAATQIAASNLNPTLTLSAMPTSSSGRNVPAVRILRFASAPRHWKPRHVRQGRLVSPTPTVPYKMSRPGRTLAGDGRDEHGQRQDGATEAGHRQPPDLVLEGAQGQHHAVGPPRLDQRPVPPPTVPLRPCDRPGPQVRGAAAATGARRGDGLPRVLEPAHRARGPALPPAAT